ncbi:hypothetical protein HPB48_007747 [Haemaphysalis longicornis]|uniref:CCHC-type domain-containing protein n=1 Tax=Haemaphysalis longicornis TaxID=44386 RepID=A0A9J6GQW3_HAELO|nr:hypothetical protein HPB48_007747 [Haemaphysalis longicornis]
MTRLSHNSSTSQGVIRISPNETNDQLVSCLHNELVEILDTKRLGLSNKALITFNSAKTPRTVRYHYEILPVAPYKPKTLVCFKCHKEGHMVHHCPNKEVCQECCIVHAFKDNEICTNAATAPYAKKQATWPLVIAAQTGERRTQQNNHLTDALTEPGAAAVPGHVRDPEARPARIRQTVRRTRRA